MNYEMITDEQMAAIEVAMSKGGSKLKDSTKELLDGFDALEVGKAFAVPVPENVNEKRFAENTKILLTNHGRKNRKVRVNPLNRSQIFVQKTAPKAK